MVQCSLDRFEIVYNGASGASYGVFLPDYPEISHPEKRYETFSVPGRDGDLISDDNSIGNITVKCTFAVIDKLFQKRIRDIKRWLRGTGKLSFSDSLETFYEVLIIDYNELERELRKYGQFSVTFTCYPYEFLKSGQKTFSTISFNPYDLCKPIYKIVGEGNYTLTVNGKTITANVGQNLTIDSRNMIAYREDGTLMNTAISGRYEDLWLPHGDTSISISGGQLSIIPQWGYKP